MVMPAIQKSVRRTDAYQAEEPLVVVEVSVNGVPGLRLASDVATPSPASLGARHAGDLFALGKEVRAGDEHSADDELPADDACRTDDACRAGAEARAHALVRSAVPVPSGLPAPAGVLAQASHENFPVALRLLPARERAQLMAVYGFARLVDDIGDELQPAEARPAALDWVVHELARARRHEATHPLFTALEEVLDLGDPVVAALEDLISANRLDQVTARYETYEDLLASCALSANPVGRLVLAIFGADSADRLACSDDVCTALQLAEHLQDLGEDARRGRIYLPAEDRRRWGCDEQDLLAPTASVALRQLVADYTRRARRLLGAAVALSDGLALRHQIALAGFAGGGLAALDAIADADFDVLATACHPSRHRVLAHGGRLLLASRRQNRGARGVR